MRFYLNAMALYHQVVTPPWSVVGVVGFVKDILLRIVAARPITVRAVLVTRDRAI